MIREHTDLGLSPFSGSFNADGSLALVFGMWQPSTLLVMDGRDGRELRRLPLPDGRMTAAGFAERPERVVAGTQDGDIHVWDSRTGKPIATWKAHLGPVRALAGSGDDRLTTLGPDGVLRLWKCSTGRLLWELPALDEPPGQRRYAAGIHDGTVEIRDDQLGTVIGNLSDVALTIGRPAMHPSGTHVAVPCSDASVRVVRLRDGRLEGAFETRSDRVRTVAYSPDGETLLVVDSWGHLASRGNLWSWDVASGERKRLAEDVYRADFTPRGDRAIVVAVGERSLLDLATGRASPLAHNTYWSPDGSRIVSVEDGSVLVRDAETLEPIQPPFKPAGGAVTVCFSPDGSLLAATGTEPVARLFDVLSGEELRALSHRDADWFGDLKIGSIAFSPDGRRIVTTSYSFWEVRCWDVATGRRLWSYDFGGGNPSSIRAVFSSGGAWVYVSGGGGPRVLDAKSGEVVDDLGTYGRSSLQETPDGRFVVVGGRNELQVLDGATLKLLYSRAEFRDLVSVRYSAVGYVDGPVEALTLGRVLGRTRSFPLEAYAARLFDPKKVRAQDAGVELPAPELPPLPELTLVPGGRRHTTSESSFALRAGATHVEPLHRFELVLDGAEVDAQLVDAATTRTSGGELALDWTLRGAPGTETTLRIDAVARDGLRSPRAWVSVRFE